MREEGKENMIHMVTGGRSIMTLLANIRIFLFRVGRSIRE